MKEMNPQQIRLALIEAARQGMLEILEEEMCLENLLADLPETEMIISIIKKQLNIDKDCVLPGDFDKEQIKKMSDAIKLSLGEPIAEAFKEVVKQPKLLKALKNLFTAHTEDFSTMDPLLSKRYSDVLLDFAERYLETPNWKKTQSIIITADYLVRNVTGAMKPRLYARMDVTWGIYLWKCGDYSEAENKFIKANAGVSVLMKKQGTDPVEIVKNRELQARVFLGFGVLYGDLLDDKTKAIKYYNDCLSTLSELGETYRNKKMRTSILNNLGVTHHKMSEINPEECTLHLNQAAQHYENSLATARSIHYTKMEGWILFNAGEIYALLGQFDKAIKYAQDSRRIFTEDVASDRGLSGVEMLEAVISMQKKEYTKALESIGKSIALREKIGEPRRLADATDYRGDIYSASGDRVSAMADYNMAFAIYSSIGSLTGVRKTEEKLKAHNTQGSP